jgi:hypothetical protein
MPLYQQTMAMIAPNRVHFRTDPQRSVVDAGRQRWELALGHGRWTVPLTEG